MTFQREETHLIFEELKPLLDLHWKEIAHYQDIPLDPAWEQYEAMEKAGALRTFTARSHTGKLIGYSVFFVRHNIHYKSSLQAVQDILFVHPEHRGVGARLLRWCDDELKKENVQVVYHHVKEAHNFGPLLERHGYKLIDLIYGRRLD